MNISCCTDNNLCLGCGVCEDICPKQAIKICLDNSEYRPKVNEEVCIGEKCGRCLKVCPGLGTDLHALEKSLYIGSNINEDRYVGYYHSLHTGYSMDGDIRFHSASGGVVTSFLIFLLEKKYIQGAVVTAFGEDHITPVSYIAKNREEVIAGRSSKYCPVTLKGIGNLIAHSEGKYVIVGLPCHIQGFRKRAAIDKRFRDRVMGYFSLYCSSNRTFGARDYLLRKYNIRKEDISYFAFRDNGCLGNLTIKTHSNFEKKTESPLVGTHSTDCRGFQIPFSQYYGRMLRSFFKPHRCLTCIDHYGALADVCFGDIHIAPYSEDKIGFSSWITRSEYWETLFKQAVSDGYIYMEDVDVKVLNESQAAMLYPKRRKAKAAMILDKMAGKKVPLYDISLPSPSVKDIFAMLICHLQRFVGRRRNLWFLIDLINRKK